MLRKDGKWNIYKVQHYDGVKWAYSNLDAFGCPEGLSPSQPCWQLTGQKGTFERDEAKRSLLWIRERNPKYKFRVVKVVVAQKTYPIAW
jgi:hypothetical protein